MKEASIGSEAIKTRFTFLADRASANAGERPEGLTAVEEALLHLGSSADRQAAQRILLQAQDAHRISLPGAPVGFTWIGGLKLLVGRGDHDPREDLRSNDVPLEGDEVAALWRLLDAEMRDLPLNSVVTMANRRADIPTWPSVIVHSTVRCPAATRAWIGFHCITNMASKWLLDFSVEGSAGQRALMVAAAIPDPSMDIRHLQDASKQIPQGGYAAQVRRRLEVGLAAFRAEYPHLQLAFEGPWQRMSTLIEQGELEGAIAALHTIGDVKGESAADAFASLRTGFPGGLDLVLGAIRTGEPIPGQATAIVLADPEDGAIVRFTNVPLLAGTALPDVAKACAEEMERLGIRVKTICLEPRPPVKRLGLETLVLPCSDGVYRNKELAFFGRAAWRFRRFDWDTGWAFDGPAFQSDEALRRLGGLPHPVAMDVAGVDTALAEHYDNALLGLIHEQMTMPGRSCLTAVSKIKATDELLDDLADRQEEQGWHFEDDLYAQDDALQPPCGVYCAAHWKRVGGTLMVAKKTLLDRLEQTSIEKGFPLHFIRLPFADLYVHFERPITYQRSDGLKFAITGFYASEESASAVEQTGEYERLVVITYTYLYSGEVLRIGGLSVNLRIRKDDERDLTDVVADYNRALDDMQTQAPDKSTIRFTNDTLVLAAKVILYTTLKNARMVESRDRSKLIEQLRGLKGNKREKLQARIKHAYDHIEIGPEDPAGESEDRIAHALVANGITPHWRRGFYRTQHFGQGMKLSYQVWIAPVLVNGHLIDGSPPLRKDYTLD